MFNRNTIEKMILKASQVFERKKYTAAQNLYQDALQLIFNSYPTHSAILEAIDSEIRLYFVYLNFCISMCQFHTNTPKKTDLIANLETAHKTIENLFNYLRGISFNNNNDNEKIQEIRNFHNNILQNLAEEYHDLALEDYRSLPAKPSLTSVDKILHYFNDSTKLYGRLVDLFAESKDVNEERRHKEYEEDLKIKLALAYEVRADTYFDAEEKSTVAGMNNLNHAFKDYEKSIHIIHSCSNYDKKYQLNLYNSILHVYSLLYPLDPDTASAHLRFVLETANRLLTSYKTMAIDQREELMDFINHYANLQSEKINTNDRRLLTIPRDITNLSATELRQIPTLLANTNNKRKNPEEKVVPVKKIKTDVAAKDALRNKSTPEPKSSEIKPIIKFNKIPRKSHNSSNSIVTERLTSSPKILTANIVTPSPIHNYKEVTDVVKTSSIMPKLRFAITAKNHSNMNPEFSTIGNVSSSNPNYYFSTSSNCLSASKEFMEFFWDNENNSNLVIEAHKQRASGNYSRHSRPSLRNFNVVSTKLNPSCISFVTVNFSGKLVCFVSTSGDKARNDNREMTAALVASAEKLKDVRPDLPRYFVLSHCSSDYNRLVYDIVKSLYPGTELEDHYPNRMCAEKYFMSMLTKIVSTHPEAKIDGSINLIFYPYKNGVDYTNDPYVMHKTNNNTGFSGKNYSYIPLECCSQCHTNRDAMLAIIHVVQTQALDQKNKISAGEYSLGVRSTSPFHADESIIMTEIERTKNATPESSASDVRTNTRPV